jgi:hypothetical protein
MQNRTILAVVISLALALFIAPVFVFSQNISGVLTGTVKDPAGAVIPAANVTLTNQSTRAAQTITTNEAGVFVFPSVLAGTYTVEVSSAGFRAYQVKDIAVTMTERRSLGDIVLQVGQLQERVEVSAEVTPVQTVSGERAGLVSGTQLLAPVRGRDFLALIAGLPGIVDTNSQSRDVSKGPGAGGLHINGGRDTSINLALDGVQDVDTGSNSGSHVQPNMDAIAEVRVLTSNYQAEYGRSSSGTISFTIKNGTQDFHGSGFWFFRHESLYANSFFNNRTGTPRPIQRINNFGYTIGGPIYAKSFNKNKDKLFFFFSQEYVRRQNYPGTFFVTTPTALERAGDFSKTFDVNGALIPIKDPSNNAAQFPGNIIPTPRINKQGLAIMNFFPLPNYTEADPALKYTRNYRSNVSGKFPRREDLFRIDYNVSSTLNAFFRATEDNDDENWPYNNWTAGGHNFDMGTTYRWQHGRGVLLHVAKTFGPTSVNEFTFGVSTRGQAFNPAIPGQWARSKMGNIGQWYPAGNESGAIPDVSFGGVQNGINGGIGNIPYHNENPVFTFVDNQSKVIRTHTLKFGVYIERMRKDEVGGLNPRGSFDFGRNTNNPFDSNYAFSNALLGNFNSYSEASLRTYSLYRYTQVEFYAQDSWRVSKRLSLELGVRFYSAPPAHDIRRYLTTFEPSTYDLKTAAVMYRPGIDPTTGKRVAIDPRNGNVAPVPYIGLFVPGSGSYAPGMVVGGTGKTPASLYTTPFSIGPRIGFAYDLSGNGKTAIRGGWGIFYDRVQGNTFSGTVGQPPVAYNPTLYFSNLDTFLQATGAVGPPGVTADATGHQPLPTVMNFSVGVQRDVGFHTVVDAAYVGSLGRHLLYQRNINPIPMFAHFDPKNIDTTTGSPLSDNYLRYYMGMGNINVYSFGATINYHSLQVSVNRRMSHGIQYGVSYTWAKALGVASTDGTAVSPYFDMRHRNYGPLSYDVPQLVAANFIWDLPDPAKRLNNRFLSLITGDWQLGGITAAGAGLPYTPGFSTSDGADITGSTEGARIDVVGNPNLPGDKRNFFTNFNAAAFARPAKSTFGTGGVYYMRNPSWSNWDMSVSKRIPWKGEERYFQLRGEFYNAWNHTEFSSYDTSFRFNPQGQQISANVGAFNGTRAPRNIQLSLRFMF